MLIRWATSADKPAWVSLAGEVAGLFGSPEMPRDPEFLKHADSKIAKYEALIAIQRMTGECLGIISFSRTHNRISWFAVSSGHRGKGVGTRLLRCAMNQLDPSKEITTMTFLDGDPAGEPARRMYRKFGFVEVDTSAQDPLGNPRCRMAKPPSDERYLDYRRWANPED